MIISEEEMETILVMYRVVEAEGQESDNMINLVERIKKEKDEPIHRQTEDEWLEENAGIGEEL